MLDAEVLFSSLLNWRSLPHTPLFWLGKKKKEKNSMVVQGNFFRWDEKKETS